MKKMMISFLMLTLSVLCFAQGIHVPITSVPTAFDSTDSQSCAITCRATHEIVVFNDATEELAVGVCDSCATTPSEDFAYIPAGADAGRVFKPVGGRSQVAGQNSLICVRVVDGSAATSGSYRVDCR